MQTRTGVIFSMTDSREIKNAKFNFLKIPSANFIGCGKLGKTMAYLLAKNRLIEVNNICNKSIMSSEKAIEFIESGSACANLSDISSANIYFISTPDDQIEEVCNKIIENNKVISPSLFVHFSGSLTSDVFNSASLYGHHVCSLHPIRSFSNPLESAKKFQGTYCAFEGSDFAYDIIAKMFNKIGGIVFYIQKEKKSLYHAASIFACNYLTTLAHCAMQCYKNSGIQEQTAKKIIESLMQGTIENIIKAENFSEALTGPLQRGDIKTIEKHLEALKSEADLEECYRILAKKTLEITKHQEEIKFSLRNCLASYNLTKL